jgi:ribose transport system ATP-binding protein
MAREMRVYEGYRQKLDIDIANPNHRVGMLSGGNQQKCVIAKWLAANPRLLIMDEPTRGIDVGAKAEIHALITRLAADGLAVLVISSEMPEIISLSHRILAMRDGLITRQFAAADVNEEVLIAAVTGHAWTIESE